MRLDKLFGMMSGLSGTYRFANAKLSNPESVLEHTGAVVLTCYFICLEINILSPGCVDVGATLSKAAIHDVEELLVGDTPRSTKYSSVQSRELFRGLEAWAMRRIVSELDVSCAQMAIDDHAKSKLDKEGVIVELADTLAVVYKINEEAIERSNRTMLSRSSSCVEQLVKMKTRIKYQHWSDEVTKFLTNIVIQAQDIVARAPTSASAISEREDERKSASPSRV